MSKENAEQVINFRLSSADADRVDRLAEKLGVTRSQFLRNIINIGLDEIEAMERLGIARSAITVLDILDWMGEKVKKVSKDLHVKTQSKV